MCGTLLFDDAEKCTKCGNDMTDKPSSGDPAVAQEEAPKEPEPEVEPTAEDSGSGDLSETSAQRKKWLEEQEKIKSELANIMGRVGRKKKPAVPPMAGGPVPTPTPTPTAVPNPTMAQAIPNSNPANPAQLPNPQQATVQPAPQQVPMQNVQPAPQPGSNTGVGTAAEQPPFQAPTPPGEGLSEVDKAELKQELDDLRNEGYNVSKLEKIIVENPGDAWRAFNDFLDDVEKLNQLKSRLESCNTEGLPALEAEKNNLISSINDPDYMSQYEGNITQFENKLLSEKSKLSQVSEEEELDKKRVEQFSKLVELGKEAYRLKDYDKAMNMFTKADQLSPGNKEIVFFKKKIEARLAEAAGVDTGDLAGAPEAIGGDKKKKKKKKKKLVSRKATPGVEAPGPPAQPPMGAPPPAEALAQQPPMPAQPVQPPPPGAQAAPEAAGDDSDGPRTAAEFEALGFNAYINKDYPKALEFYEKVLQIDPNFPNVQNIISECLMRLGKA